MEIDVETKIVFVSVSKKNVPLNLSERHIFYKNSVGYVSDSTNSPIPRISYRTLTPSGTSFLRGL